MQVLSTKFYIPRINEASYVPRGVLIKELDAALNKNLILVCAPAGFGKTSLLSHWTGGLGTAVTPCWLSLNTRDRDPLTFWTYVIQAFNHKVPGICGRAALQLSARADVENVLITLINEIEASGQRMLLVLDDYHLAENEEIRNGLDFFFDHPVHNLVIAVSTRRMPEFMLSRLRVTGRLCEITEPELKLSFEETRAVIRGARGSGLTREEAVLIHRKTEGWAAAVKMAVISLERDKDLAGLWQGDGLLGDYLMEEIFSGLPGPVRSFLLKISLPERLNPDLCRSLTRDPDTPRHIRYLKQHQLFYIPLDETGETGGWFRFHHLFQDFLRKTLENTAGGAVIRDLHLKASAWFENARAFEEAFVHALAGDRQDIGARILAQNISRLYSEGGEPRLKHCLNRLSSETILGQPVLAVYHYGLRLFGGDFDILQEMQVLLDRCQDPQGRQILEGFYQAFDGYRDFYLLGELEAAIEKLSSALGIIPAEHGSMRRAMEFVLTLCYRYLGRIKPAIALSMPREDDDLVMSAMSVMNRAGVELELGHLTAARQMVEEKIRIIEKALGESIPPMYGFLYITMGKILGEEYRLKEAFTCFKRGLGIIEKTGFIEMIVISFWEYTILLTAMGEYDQAHGAIDRAIRVTEQSFSWIRGLMTAQKHQIWIAENKLGLARPWIDTFPVFQGMEVVFARYQEYLIVARYYIAAGRPETSLPILDAMIPQDEKDRRHGRLMECYVLKAKALAGMGRTKEGADLLIKAFELTRSQGHVAVYLNDIKGMESLYLLCHKKNAVPPYLVPRLEGIKAGKDRTRTVLINEFSETFNEREIQILNCLKKGLSNKEAAESLFLSVNTVRWYAQRIFAKLDVKRRGQAVSAARELNLI